MFRDGFFKPQGVWCAAHGVCYQVHLNHEEMEMDLTRSEGDFIRDMKYVEVPGIDAIWHQIWTDTISDYPRLASSRRARLRPSAVVHGELRRLPPCARHHPGALHPQRAARPRHQPDGDDVLLRHAASSPPARHPLRRRRRPQLPAPPPHRHAAEGPSEVMRDPGLPALADYVRRVGYVLSMGRPAASVALYLPSSSMWLNDRDSDTAFVATEQMLSERQIDFDIINQDALATDLKAGPGIARDHERQPATAPSSSRPRSSSRKPNSTASKPLPKAAAKSSSSAAPRR